LALRHLLAPPENASRHFSVANLSSLEVRLPSSAGLDPFPSQSAGRCRPTVDRRYSRGRLNKSIKADEQASLLGGTSQGRVHGQRQRQGIPVLHSADARAVA